MQEILLSIWSAAMPLETKNTQESFLELVIGKSVAKRVNGTIEVAKPIRYVVQQLDIITSLSAEADNHGQDVPRCPTDDKCAENYRDRAKRLPSAVLNQILLFMQFVILAGSTVSERCQLLQQS